MLTASWTILRNDQLLVDGFSTKIARVRQELRALVYPSSIDLSSRTLRYLTGQLTARRQEIGRGGGAFLSDVRPCSPWPTCGAVTLAPSSPQCSASASRPCKAFVILDGTLLPIDRIAADAPYYSGKHKRHGMNVQVLTDPFGRLLWASPVLPGSTHDLTAARQHGIIEALADAGLKCWADKAYQGAGDPSGYRFGAAATSDGSVATTPPTPRSADSASGPWPPSRAGASCGSSAAAPTESPIW